MYNNHNVIYGNLFFIHYQNKGKITETQSVLLISCNLIKTKLEIIKRKTQVAIIAFSKEIEPVKSQTFDFPREFE